MKKAQGMRSDAMKNMNRWFAPASVVLAGALSFSLDRLTKAAAREGFLDSIHVSSWLTVTTHRNFGLMGDISLPGFMMAILILSAMFFLVLALNDACRRFALMECVFLGLVLGGAWGNIYDRLTLGYVFDWLMFFQVSVINLADVMIALGLAAYIWFHLRPKIGQGVDCQTTTTDQEYPN